MGDGDGVGDGNGVSVGVGDGVDATVTGGRGVSAGEDWSTVNVGVMGIVPGTTCGGTVGDGLLQATSNTANASNQGNGWPACLLGLMV